MVILELPASKLGSTVVSISSSKVTSCLASLSDISTAASRLDYFYAARCATQGPTIGPRNSAVSTSKIALSVLRNFRILRLRMLIFSSNKLSVIPGIAHRDVDWKSLNRPFTE